MSIISGTMEIATAPLATSCEAIDRQHLSRMTFGEESLEREVLMLFERQAGMLLQRMVAGECSVAATAAHTLKGSAQGIGAWRVAFAAEAVEQADAATQGVAIDTLAGAIAEARVAIDGLVHGHQ